MANDTCPMGRMIKACQEVLCQELVPLHYADLTGKALSILGLSREDVNWKRQIEDVREKVLIAGRFNSFYIGKPLCLGGLKWWFETEQLRLLKPTSGIYISGHAAHGANGAFEALMRAPHMLNKDNALPIRRARRISTGLVLEKHVAGWFEQNWPDFYLPPDNDGLWQKPCDHDFKLIINNTFWKVDVSGRSIHNSYGSSSKQRIALHLLCEIIDQDVLWHSIVTGKKFDCNINPDFQGKPPEHLIVWLNCKRDGLDYETIKQLMTGL